MSTEGDSNKKIGNFLKLVKDNITQLEVVILVFSAIIVLTLHNLNLLDYIESISSTILIVISLLTIHEVIKGLKQDDIIDEIKNISGKLATIFKTIEEIKNENSLISDKFHEAHAIGFRKIFAKREEFINNFLPEYIRYSNDSTAIIAICLTMLRERYSLSKRYINLIVDKIVGNREYKFEFYILKTDLYEDRAKLEESNPEDLYIYRNTSLLNLLMVKALIYQRTGNIEDIKRIIIKEYDVMPTVSEFLIDKSIFYGPYVAKKCGDIPIVEIEKISEDPEDPKTIYGLMFDHYQRIIQLSNPLYLEIDKSKLDLDHFLSKKSGDGSYRIEGIYNLLEEDSQKGYYYSQIIKKPSRSFEDILVEIGSKLNQTK